MILLIFFILNLLTLTANASITLPLQGYCKPGRYFPIQVDGSDTAAALLFSADGCIPTQTQPASGGRRIIPMLAGGFPTLLRTTSGTSIALRTPGENERLIATTTADVSAAMTIFPGKRLLPIRLDPAEPLPGPPAAWETLDAVLLDADGFARITDNQRSALLAGGVVLISTSDEPPDTRWPWVHREQLWILSQSLAGPVGESVNEDVYAPTYAWNPGWSLAVRGQVMGAATLLVILTIALLLRPNRWTLGSAIALPVLATVAIGAWRASLSTIHRAGGNVICARGRLIQNDAWVYERARESSAQSVEWMGWTHPLFASDASIPQSQMKLIVGTQGDLQFSYFAAADHTMAFVRREVLPGEVPAATMPIQSPMVELARAVYLQQGDHVAGQIPAPPGRWPTVVVTNERR